MELYISGQAKCAAELRGDKICVYNAHNLPNTYECSASKMGMLFSGTSDLQKMTAASEKEIIKLLNVEISKDQSLLLLLSLLDRQLTNTQRQQAAEVLEECLQECDEAYQFIENKLYSAAMVKSGCIESSLVQSENYNKVQGFLRQLLKDQDHIETNRIAWDSVPVNRFADSEEKKHFETILIENGLFKEAAKAISLDDASIMNQMRFNAFSNKHLLKYPDHRSILQAWINPLIKGKASAKDHADFSKMLTSSKETSKKFKKKKSTSSDYTVFEQATKSIDTIKELLHDNKSELARRYTYELINMQVANEDQEYAAMSLSNISKEALNVHNKSLAIELSKKAIELAPLDTIAWGSYAEATIALGQYEETHRAINKIRTYGEECIADIFEMKVLRFQGRLKEIQQKYPSVIENNANSDRLWILYHGAGIANKLIGDLKESYSNFTKAVETAPYEAEARNSLAQLYMYMGDFESALKVIEEAFSKQVYSSGTYLLQAQIHEEKGAYDAALKIYKQAIARTPSDIETFKSLANFYIDHREYDHAQRVCLGIEENFPYDYSGVTGRSTAYVKMKKFKKAENLVKKAMQEFKSEVGLKIFYAKLLKDIGSPKRALQTYSQICTEHPQSHSAQVGQANLFKELGDYQGAINLYNKITDQRKAKSIAISKAAIYVALGEFDKVFATIPDKEMQTREDWVGYHIVGMALLKSGNKSAAQKHFKYGYENVSFSSQRKYFKTALAITMIKRREYGEALSALENREDPISNVIKLHAYCGLNKSVEASQTYKELIKDTDDNIVYLCKEIGAHFGLNRKPQKHESRWISDKECDLLSIDVSIDKAA